jgi:hypothetical protein
MVVSVRDENVAGRVDGHARGRGKARLGKRSRLARHLQSNAIVIAALVNRNRIARTRESYSVTI